MKKCKIIELNTFAKLFLDGFEAWPTHLRVERNSLTILSYL